MVDLTKQEPIEFSCANCFSSTFTAIPQRNTDSTAWMVVCPTCGGKHIVAAEQNGRTVWTPRYTL